MARAPLNADRAERVSPHFFQTGKRGDSAAPDSGVEVLPCPTRQLLAREHESENVFFQDTVIEFGTPQEVLLVLDRPLQFADRVLVESNDGTLHAEAFVVAVQYHLERTAVAVRFLKNVPNWIVKS